MSAPAVATAAAAAPSLYPSPYAPESGGSSANGASGSGSGGGSRSEEVYLPHAAQIILIAKLNAIKTLPHKPLSPYQLFVAEVKAERRKSNPDSKIANSLIHTEAAAKWEKFTPDEKRKYELMHSAQNTAYESELKRLKLEPMVVAAELKALLSAANKPGGGGGGASNAAAILAPTARSASGGPPGSGDELQLPLSRIKRVMQCDSDIKQISKEAAALTAKACELFVGWFAKQCGAMTQKANKKTVRPTEFYGVMKKEDALEFLRGTIPRPTESDSQTPRKRKAEAAAALQFGSSSSSGGGSGDGGAASEKRLKPLFTATTSSAAAPIAAAAAAAPALPVAAAASK